MSEQAKTDATEKTGEDSRITALARAVVDEQQKRAAEAVPDLSRMGNGEFREYVQKTYGF